MFPVEVFGDPVEDWYRDGCQLKINIENVVEAEEDSEDGGDVLVDIDNKFYVGFPENK